ncbi:MAG: DUF370 domain-containing protein [Thermodesulfovibrionales bacterium]|nr:DUF370 domain-containing protein [Thermodesulfovibrionales bacterium]
MAGVPIISIGFNNMVLTQKIVAIINPNSLPMRKLKEEARQRGKLIDATEGKKTRSIIITESDHIILSAIQPETLAQRIKGSSDNEIQEQ